MQQPNSLRRQPGLLLREMLLRFRLQQSKQSTSDSFAIFTHINYKIIQFKIYCTKVQLYTWYLFYYSTKNTIWPNQPASKNLHHSYQLFLLLRFQVAWTKKKRWLMKSLFFLSKFWSRKLRRHRTKHAHWSSCSPSRQSSRRSRAASRARKAPGTAPRPAWSRRALADPLSSLSSTFFPPREARSGHALCGRRACCTPIRNKKCAREIQRPRETLYYGF